MKPALTVLLFLSTVVAAPTTSPAQAPIYGWSISLSSTDPFVNTGAFQAGTIPAWIWLACSTDGLSGAEFGVVSDDPANIVPIVVPLNNFTIAGIPPALVFTVDGCPGAPIVAAVTFLLSNAPGQYCIAPSSKTGHQVTRDCSDTLWPIQWIGLSLDGAPPCSYDWVFCETPISVNESSWGGVKSLYR